MNKTLYRKVAMMMTQTKLWMLLICISMLVLAGCNAGSEQKETSDYEGTKKMVADILKTDEGKKAITEVLSGDDMQQTYVVESSTMKEAVTEALSSDKGKEFWEKLFKDPKFVESYALAMQDQQKEVLKNLMSDPEYQKKLIEILSNPDMEKQLLTVVTGQEFRSHLEKVMEETFSSPIFQAKLADLILQAAQEMKPPQEGGGGGSSSDESGSGSEGGGSGEEKGGEQSGGGGS